MKRAFVFLFFLLPLAACAAEPLTLFGAPLKGATRAELRQVLVKAGFAPNRVDDKYFCDNYAVRGQLKGASQLSVCYTEGDNKFATAEYTFPGFMNMDLVKHVIAMVETKYGRPNGLSGDFGLGPVVARWVEPQGMQVKVSRGWPDTTTYLDLADKANAARMNAQIHRDQQQRVQQQAHHDANAF